MTTNIPLHKELPITDHLLCKASYTTHALRYWHYSRFKDEEYILIRYSIYIQNSQDRYIEFIAITSHYK